MTVTSCAEVVSTKLQRIAELASRHRVLTTLAHHVDVTWLHEAYRRTRKGGAVGVDRQTASEYAADLEGNLRSLHERFRNGTYRAPPVRRVHIPKGDGRKTRPIGIPTFEDKVLQRAVAMVLEPIYEQDFLDCSYGFRPGRSAHQALEALQKGLWRMHGGWVVEVDIERFFDTLDHPHLRAMLDRRMKDGVLRRVIHKWLKAGVLEDGCVKHPESGSPQGGVISPLLANIYLHEVMDTWFERDVRPRLQGRCFMVRYADDMVVVCEQEGDARKLLEVLPKRFGRYGLRLHPDKTRLVRFPRPSLRGPGDGIRPGSFNFLGFTHHWGKSRRGCWIVQRKTAKDRFTRALRRIRDWCRGHRHWSLDAQHRALSQKLQGHYGYYGITGNARALVCFHFQVERAWRAWLDRRAWKARMTWERFNRLLQRYPLPPARVVHSIYRPSAKPTA